MSPHKAHYKDGNGVENEKLDSYWHIAHNAKDGAEFDTNSKQPWVKAWNQDDGEPSKNIFRKDTQGLHQAMDATNPPGLVSDHWPTQSTVASHDKNPAKSHVTDGNGSNNEKLDAYWHIGHNSKTPEEFDNRSRQPW